MTDSHPTEQSSRDPAGVARAYDRWAAQYDSDHNATRDLDADVVRRAPLDVAGRRVLELGCGTGKNSAWLAERARELIALDFSAGMLAVARERVRVPNARFVERDIRTPWPVATNEVDVVVGNLVLEHVRDLAPVFAEAARVLRAGGQLFLCELHPYRQLRGGQAHFTDGATSETVPVAAYLHSTSEYVNGALAAGFMLRELGEWLEPDAPEGAPPRLLSLLFERG
ncbi:MAG TPA: class I SAM-dependent methyltransferase [Gemmatimonadaceae bacterium]|jgi:ubiquinone/menaquinone biosynthesis C-methylase UbiE|nr:class I SAM-dependent methyltransferase [Gemmatimonadaceae bacterium]